MLHLVVGIIATVAGLASVVFNALAFPTPEWGPYGSAASFLLSAITIGTVTTAMLLGHWYLVVPNLSIRPSSSSSASLPPVSCSRRCWPAALVLLSGHRGFPRPTT